MPGPGGSSAGSSSSSSSSTSSSGFVYYGNLEGAIAKEEEEEEEDEEEKGDEGDRFGSHKRRKLDVDSKEENGIDGGKQDTFELSAATREEQQKHAEKLWELEVKKKERTLTVTTDDAEVKIQLRELGHPICLFGEREYERRQRLRSILAELQLNKEEWETIQKDLEKAVSKQKGPGPKIDTDGQEIENNEEEVASSQKRDRKKVFYTRATDELIAARAEIFEFSMKNSQKRIQEQKKAWNDPDAVLALEEKVVQREESVRTMELNASQVGDTRPLSCCSLHGPNNQIATGSFSGKVKLWSSETLERVATLEGHEDRCVSLEFNPKNPNLLLTGSADCSARLWKLNEMEIVSDEREASSRSGMDIDKMEKNVGEEEGAEEEKEKEEEEEEEEQNVFQTSIILSGHMMRLSTVAWHPMGEHVATCSYDHTWRFWDVETEKQLLLQEGHEYPVYGFSFQSDGSLAVSCDLMGICRLWDLRCGKAIHSLLGHADGVLCADFSVNGFHVATGSLDHSARVWDLRKRSTQSIIPGHFSLVSQVCFDRGTGSTLVTSSYDRTCKIWSVMEGRLIKTLIGHDHLITDMSLSPSADRLVTCSFDRTWKSWKIA